MAGSIGLSRRQALRMGAAASALPLVHIRTGRAAGKLTIGFWDHWVPQANPVMQKQVDAWAAKNQVEVRADFIASTGQKLQMTGVAEAQAKSGHDVMAFFNWDIHNLADSLEPVDDVMARLVADNGAADPTTAYLAKVRGHWKAVPTSFGHADQAALRAHQLVQEARDGPANGVSGAAGVTRRRPMTGPGTRS